MILIAGLGNPGEKYENTWHNAGFIAIDQLKEKIGHFSDFKDSKKVKAEIAISPDRKIILAKPQTFMNNSGLAVKSISAYYKIKPSSVWIIHDDIDLPIGKIRISQNASAGGHNGVKSIIAEIGTQNFIRFRIGIRPECLKMTTEKYVLKKIDKNSKLILQSSLEKITTAILDSIEKDPAAAMNRYN